MTMLSADVFTNMTIAALDLAFANGPVVLKILTQQGVEIGTTTASGYSHSVGTASTVSVNVTFTGILPFIAQSNGTPYKVEVWDNTAAAHYFTMGIGSSSEVSAGSRINITGFSHTFNSPYSTNPIRTYNSVFPVEFRITYPAVLLENQYHYPLDHTAYLRHPTEVTIGGSPETIGIPRFFGAGANLEISGRNNGFKVNFNNVRTGIKQNHFNLSATWEDSLTALWTITSTVPVPVDYSIKLDWSSKFFSEQLIGSVPAQALGPLDLTVERKLYGENSFTPVAVTQTSQISGLTYYSSLSVDWEWKLAS